MQQNAEQLIAQSKTIADNCRVIQDTSTYLSPPEHWNGRMQAEEAYIPQPTAVGFE